MKLFVYLVVRFADVALSVVLMAMLLRAILSFFMTDEDSKLSALTYAVTEPFIVPVRMLFEKFGWFEGMPIDVAFFVTCILIEMIRITLSAIPY